MSNRAKIGSMCVSCLFALLLLEAGLRIAGTPNYALRSAYTPDNELGWKPRSGFTGRVREGYNFVRLNSQGFHDREHVKKKPRGTLRIALLGDSMVQGVQVSVEQTLSAVLERGLASSLNFRGTNVESLNFGIAGYGTAQELLLLREVVWVYSPDVVVLVFFPGNDLTDDSRTLDMLGLPRPYFVESNGRLVPDNSFRSSFGFRFAQSVPGRVYYQTVASSRLLEETGNALRMYVHPVRLARTLMGKPIPPAGNEAVDYSIWNEPADPDWKAAWKTTEDLIVEMRNEVVAHGAKFLVVIADVPVQSHPDPVLRRGFMKYLNIETLFYPDSRIEALGTRERIPVLDLAPLFQQYAERHNIFLHGFEVNKSLGRGHWNEAGHRLAGEVIAHELCGGLLAHSVPSRSQTGISGRSQSPRVVVSRFLNREDLP